MAELVDVFNNDAFSMASMTTAIETAPSQPRQLKDAGMFVSEPARSNIVAVEYRNGKFQIAPVDNRGDVISTDNDDDRVIRYIETKRVAKHTRLNASSLQFVTQFGSDLTRVVAEVQTEIARRQTGPTGLMSQCENTLELMRLGALKGKVLAPSGRTIWDFFAEFDITESPLIYLDIATLVDGNLREAIESQIVRPMQRRAAGLIFDVVDCWVGEEAWDTLMKNAEFRATYLATPAADRLREGTLGRVVTFAGVNFREYFGADDGASINLGADEMVFSPAGETGMYQHIKSPGEGFSDLGSLGKDWYSYTVMDPEGLERFVDLYVMTYPGFFNTRPDMVQRASSRAS